MVSQLFDLIVRNRWLIVVAGVIFFAGKLGSSLVVISTEIQTARHHADLNWGFGFQKALEAARSGNAQYVDQYIKDYYYNREAYYAASCSVLVETAKLSTELNKASIRLQAKAQ